MSTVRFQSNSTHFPHSLSCAYRPTAPFIQTQIRCVFTMST